MDIFEQITLTMSRELALKFDEAFKAKLVACLKKIEPGFDEKNLLAYASRVSISIVKGDQHRQEVWLDMKDAYGSGTFLFWYSDEVKTEYQDGVYKATIG